MPMKKFLYTLVVLGTFNFTVQAQSSVISSLTSTPDTNVSTSDEKLDYIVMNSTDKKLRSDFRELKINIAPNQAKGVLSLEITSPKAWTLLFELKNSLEDVLLFQEVELKEGLNTIPFETDDASITSFTLKMSEVSSNYSASLSMLRR